MLILSGIRYCTTSGTCKQCGQWARTFAILRWKNEDDPAFTAVTVACPQCRDKILKHIKNQKEP